MIRTIEQNFWAQTYPIEDLVIIQQRKRKEIFRLSDRTSKRAAKMMKHLSDDVNNIQMAIEATKNV
jgi:hypothetical protein